MSGKTQPSSGHITEEEPEGFAAVLLGHDWAHAQPSRALFFPVRDRAGGFDLGGTPQRPRVLAKTQPSSGHINALQETIIAVPLSCLSDRQTGRVVLWAPFHDGITSKTHAASGQFVVDPRLDESEEEEQEEQEERAGGGWKPSVAGGWWSAAEFRVGGDEEEEDAAVEFGSKWVTKTFPIMEVLPDLAVAWISAVDQGEKNETVVYSALRDREKAGAVLGSFNRLFSPRGVCSFATSSSWGPPSDGQRCDAGAPQLETKSCPTHAVQDEVFVVSSDNGGGHGGDNIRNSRQHFIGGLSLWSLTGADSGGPGEAIAPKRLPLALRNRLNTGYEESDDNLHRFYYVQDVDYFVRPEDGRVLLCTAGGADCDVRVIDASTGESIHRWTTGNDWPWNICVNSQRGTVLAGTNTGLHEFDLRTGMRVNRSTSASGSVKLKGGHYEDLICDSSGNLYFTNYDNAVFVISPDGVLLGEIELPFVKEIRGVCFDEDNMCLIVCTEIMILLFQLGGMVKSASKR